MPARAGWTTRTAVRPSRTTGCTVEPLVGRVGEIGDAVTRYYRGVITKMIPRKRPVFGAAVATGTPAAKPPDPTTQPHHNVADEAPPDLALRALVDASNATSDATLRSLRMQAL